MAKQQKTSGKIWQKILSQNKKTSAKNLSEIRSLVPPAGPCRISNSMVAGSEPAKLIRYTWKVGQVFFLLQLFFLFAFLFAFWVLFFLVCFLFFVCFFPFGFCCLLTSQ